MRYRLFGRSGLRVSAIALGTMTFGNQAWGADREESRGIFDAFVEAGGNFVDTANRYADGASETFLGEFLAADRERIVLATKYTLYQRRDHPNASGNHRKNLVESLEKSLGRLRTSYIDVLWVHAWDGITPLEELMRALDDVVRAGKALYVGISDAPAWVVARANTLAELSRWTPFTGLQIEYSLAQRHGERELLPMARALGLAVTPWGPLAGGVLTGKYAADRSAAEPARYAGSAVSLRLNERNFEIARVVREIADEIGHSPAQVALNWVRQQPGTIVPIVGARRVDQIRDSLAALAWELDPGQLARLDRVAAIELGFPHDFLAQDNIRELVSGGFDDRIERPRA